MTTLIVFNEDKSKGYLVHAQDTGLPTTVGEIDYLKFEDDEWLCGTNGYAPYVLGPFTLIMLGEVPPLRAAFVNFTPPK